MSSAGHLHVVCTSSAARFQPQNISSQRAETALLKTKLQEHNLEQNLEKYTHHHNKGCNIILHKELLIFYIQKYKLRLMVTDGFTYGYKDIRRVLCADVEQ